MEKDFYRTYLSVESYHWWMMGRKENLRAILEAYVPRKGKTEKKLLDVGCGPGSMLDVLGKFGHAYGTDMSPEAVGFCKERGVDCRVLLSSSESLPFKSESFDVACCFDLLEHIEDDRSCLNEVYRVIKKDGLIFITVPAFKFLWGQQDEISHHKRRYTRREIEELIKGRFEVRKLSYFNTLLFPPIFVIRTAMRVVQTFVRERPPVESDFTYNKEGVVNDLLFRIFSLEKFLLKRFNLPFGVSILAVGKKV